jgi:2-desacetyl-2-hydroxyethyl bacteriochlorophyllide A dehydrogenase
MRVATFEGPGRIELHDVQLAPIGPRDVLLDVEACGVCGSDIASFDHGHYVTPGQVMGHEICAHVAAVGSEIVGLKIGAQVAVRPMGTCGKCEYCTSGNSNLCGETSGRSLGYGLAGGFAEQIRLTNVDVGVDVLAIEPALLASQVLWAEPLAVAVHAVGLLGAPPVDSLLVVGAGSVGLCAIAVAFAVGVRDVVVVEPREQRRAAAASLGARVFEHHELDDDVLVDGALDTSGVPQVIIDISRRVRRGGLVVLLGLGDGVVPWPVRGVELTGSFAYTDADFRQAVDHIVSGRVRMERFVTHEFSLEETASALAIASVDVSAVKAAVIPRRNNVE